MKNLTFDLLHSFAVVIFGLVGLLFGCVEICLLLAVMFFVGRELTQAEYKWIEHYGFGLRANMPWWGALDLRVWDFHSWFWNLTFPVMVAIGFYVLFITLAIN